MRIRLVHRSACLLGILTFGLYRCGDSSAPTDQSSAGNGGAGAAQSSGRGLLDASAGGGGDGRVALDCGPGGRASGPTTVDVRNTGSPPSGPYTVVVERDPGLPEYTVYRPADLRAGNLPVIAWGEGGCAKDGLAFAEFLSELTSYGFLIIADGAPTGAVANASAAWDGGFNFEGGFAWDGGLAFDGSMPGTSGGASFTMNTDGAPLIQAIDWAMAENARPCSQYYQKLDTAKVAVMGQSCGGLMALNAAGDHRLTTVVAWNSGLLSPDQKIYDSLHAPLAIIDGGSEDIAYANGARDFDQIGSVPVVFANYPYGHMGAYAEDNGGEFGKAGVAWLKWQMLGDHGAHGKEMFVGSDCGLCTSGWSVEHKSMD